jgi:hypothetical protein
LDVLPGSGFSNHKSEETIKAALQQKDFGKASNVSYEIALKYHDAKRTTEAKKALDQSILYATKSNVPSLAIQPGYLLGSILYESRITKTHL